MSEKKPRGRPPKRSKSTQPAAANETSKAETKPRGRPPKKTKPTQPAASFEVEAIVGEENGMFQVRWKGYGSDADTLEPLSNLDNADKLIAEYRNKKPRAADKRRSTAATSEKKPRGRPPKKAKTAEDAGAPVVLTYFPIDAKGTSIALALAHSGITWEGRFVQFADWSVLKPQTPWGHVPLLEVPGIGTIGHEMAILNWIGREAPATAGATEKDFAASQQVLAEAEDIFGKFGKTLNKIGQDRKNDEDIEAFWNGADLTAHIQRGAGFLAHCHRLETFLQAQGYKDRFTSTGTTLGECKLFSVLRIAVTIRGKKTTVAKYPGLAAFYKSMAANKITKSVVETGDNFVSEEPASSSYLAKALTAAHQKDAPRYLIDAVNQSAQPKEQKMEVAEPFKAYLIA